MIKRWFAAFMVALWFAIGAAPGCLAQEASGQQPGEKQEKEKTAPEEKALVLLEQIVAESAVLRLPENRIRLQLTAADLLWDHNQERARSLFNGVATALIEMMGRQPAVTTNNRQNYNQGRFSATQLRQELVLTAARHDATLAYQLLQATQQPALPTDSQIGRQANSEANLEQRLLAQIARTDPLLAIKNAEEMLEKGQYPGSLAQVLAQLQVKDKEAAAKFSEKLVKRLQMENLLAKQDASSLALSLVRQGPRPADNATAGANVRLTNSSPVLSEAAFAGLLETLIAAALKATPPTPSTGRGQNMRGRPNGFPNGGNNAQAQQNSAQMEQNNARMLLMGVQSLLPQIDKYLPARSTAVRQKLTQMGMDNSQRAAFNQIAELMQQGTSESLLTAAATAPPGMQSELYQQAARKALDEGNTERARQIASDHLNPAQRNAILQTIEARQLAGKAGDDAMESIRQGLYRLSSDEERVKMLLQLSGATQKDNPKLALQILIEAQKFVSGRLSSYQQFDSQLQVAKAFAAVDPARSFEVLEPGINQLNELFPAAALLSGFEVNIFRDGELPLQDGSRLSQMVNQYAEQLASLAKHDFERAQMTADKFQLPEARLFTRLAIARGLLGGQAVNNNRFGNRDFGPNMPFTRRQQ
jgi:hypothetical protein